MANINGKFNDKVGERKNKIVFGIGVISSIFCGLVLGGMGEKFPTLRNKYRIEKNKLDSASQKTKQASANIKG